MCCIFPRVERALMFCVIFFLHVEHAQVLLCCIFRAWNALWRYFVIFSAGETCSGIIVLYFPRVERALALLCYISTHGTRSGFILLYFPCVEGPHVERALALLCYIFRAWYALWNY